MDHRYWTARQSSNLDWKWYEAGERIVRSMSRMTLSYILDGEEHDSIRQRAYQSMAACSSMASYVMSTRRA